MTTPATVFMFSGQGSQYYQMGRELFDTDPRFRSHLSELDEAVQETLGASVLDTLYDHTRTKAERFDHLPLTNAALFLIEFALASTLIDSGLRPDYVLGSSMGTLAALAIARCVSPRQALDAAVAMAQIVTDSCPRGAMIAIFADPQLYFDDPLFHCSDIAAINSPSHFVIALPAGAADAVESQLQAKSILFQRLPVNYAFHSRWIEGAQSRLLACFAALPCQATSIPIVCCMTGSVLNAVHPQYLWSMVRQPIRLDQAIRRLERYGPCRYIDTGPSGSLAGVVKQLIASDSASRAIRTLSPFGGDAKQFALVRALGR